MPTRIRRSPFRPPFGALPRHRSLGEPVDSGYEPRLNRACQELAAHYGTAVLPASPRRPADKAKAETGCQIAEGQILAPLRNHSFFSLDELRREVEPLLTALNEKPFQKLPGSRRSWFEEVDVPALKPLPGERHEYAEWRKSMVNIDYHIQVKHALYSVPHALARKKVDSGRHHRHTHLSAEAREAR